MDNMSQTPLNNEGYIGFINEFLQRFTTVSKDDLLQLIPHVEFRTFPKKIHILQKGEIDNYLNLVAKGLVRKYIVTGKKETTLQLATEGHLIQSELSFHRREPSEVFIESIEPSVLISISYDNVQYLLREMPNGERIGRALIADMFVKKDSRYYNQLKRTTRERFLDYMEHHPHMLQRVPQKILASYLDIKPETFSRLKHLMLKK